MVAHDGSRDGVKSSGPRRSLEMQLSPWAGIGCQKKQEQSQAFGLSHTVDGWMGPCYRDRTAGPLGSELATWQAGGEAETREFSWPG